YMAREDEVIPGATGDVTAPKGTEVTVTGRADRAVTSAALVVTGGPKELALAATVSGRDVEARFVVSAPGAWRFRVVDADGDEVLDPVARKILLRPDAPPTVRLDEPSEDRTVQLDDE